MLQKLYTYLATFPLLPSNLKAVLNMLEQLYRDLATFPLLTNNLKSYSKHAFPAVQAPGDLPLVLKEPQSCS